MSADPERAPIVDLGAEVDRVMREMVAAGFEDEDGDPDDWAAAIHPGDGRLG